MQIKQLEERIKSLNLQLERMREITGPGPHIDALETGTKMAVEEIQERIDLLRAEQIQSEMHGPNGYPTFEHEKACGYNPFHESM